MSIELRHRTSSRELTTYSRVKSSSDDYDHDSDNTSSPIYNNLSHQKMRLLRIPIPKSTLCVKV